MSRDTEDFGQNTWTVVNSNGAAKDITAVECDVEGDALTFRNLDGDITHAWGSGYWAHVHAKDGKK